MKKRIQRIAVFLLTVVLLAGFAAGCSKSGDKQKALRVGMECNYAPYNWSQSTSANGAVKISNSNEYANGYDVMMAQRIADALGYRLEIIKTQWDGLAPGVDSGKLDAVIAGMSATADRKKSVDFTDNYYTATIYALVKKDGKFANAKSIQDLKGAVCTSQLSTIWYDLLQQVPDADIQPALADVTSMIVSLQSGKCEMLLVDKPTALAAVYANKDLMSVDLSNDPDLKVPQEQINIGVAVKKGNAELKDAINKALANISEDDRTEMMNQAIQNQPLADGTMPQNGDDDFWYWVGRMLDEYGSLFLQGAGVTLLLALVGTLIGCIVGLLVGVLRTIPKPKKNQNPIVKGLYWLLQFLLVAYIEVFRGTPMMVQAMVLYFGSMSVFNIDMSPMFAGFFVVSINTGAYMAESVRGGIESIDAGQTEAAEALGMTHWQTMTTVVMPQTFRIILPQIGNNLIINIKDTSVLNVISVTELYFVANSAAGVYYKFFVAFSIVCVIYFIMTFVSSRLLRMMERKIDGDEYYALVDLDAMADPTGMVTSGPIRKGGMHKWGK
jgi:putative lysine transport system permease protein